MSTTTDSFTLKRFSKVHVTRVSRKRGKHRNTNDFRLWKNETAVTSHQNE